MSVKGDANKNQQSAKVLQLGFNISVSGDPGTDIQIVLDDKEKGAVQSSIQNILKSSEPAQISDDKKLILYEIEAMDSDKKSTESTGAVPKQSRSSKSSSPSSTSKRSGSEKTESSKPKDLNLISEIQNTMEHLEKFSDRIKEIPRLKAHPIAASTPLSDKQNSKSESNLMGSDYRHRRFGHLYDFHSRKDYFRVSKPPDLFLKPLPGENFYKRGIITRYFDLEPYRHYGSVDSLSNQTSKFEVDRYETEVPHGILKKSDSESGDKQSTSSADSVKDIKIYQSGGILIMQNFKDGLDMGDRKEISEFSAKLIENCNKLKEEVSLFSNGGEKSTVAGNSSDELKKVVQFDLSSYENQKSSKNGSGRMESSESTSDCPKTKDNSPQGTFQSQDFPSLSTQENDSIISNQPDMSPTSGTTSKKLEWDSGADVGYLNLDLSKENLSTLERIVLKGLSSDGLSEKKVVYEKKPDQPHTNRSKFILERMPSELVIEEVVEVTTTKTEKETLEAQYKAKNGIVHEVDQSPSEFPKDEIQLKADEAESSKPQLSKEDTRKESSQEPQTKQSIDKSINVNTLFSGLDSYIQNVRHQESTKLKSRLSPKVKKLKKKKSPIQKSILTAPLKEKIHSIIDITRGSGKSEEMGVPKRVHRNVEAKPELELSREVDEIIIDQRFKIKQNVGGKEKLIDVKKDKAKGRPVSGSSSSNNTVMQKEEAGETEGNKFTDQTVQTTEAKVESIGVQAFASQKSSDCDFQSLSRDRSLEVPKVPKAVKEGVNMISKNIQAFGLNSSLPKQLAHPKESKSSDNQNTKSTQFFGGPINSLPNYHSSLITKPVESCGRMPKVLKTRKNIEAEFIRVKEENEKNIIANDLKSLVQEQNSKEEKEDVENKENLIMENLSNKSEVSKKSSKGSKEKRNEERKEKSGTVMVETSECFQTSNDVPNIKLRRKMLKEHGDSIDRNIIQEKYFQSQLVEIEKREMKSRSTSMERPIKDGGADGKECATVGCQYSPKEESYRTQDSSKKGKEKARRKEASSQNTTEENRLESTESTNQEREFGTNSLPSSTQTAHSWVPGMQDTSNSKSGVGRARSFEYLPGHIYESSGNLRDLPSNDDQNIVTCSSAASSELDAGVQPMSDDAKDSEGRTTLVLENTSDTSQDSLPMKLLDENLSQLKLVVSKLWEKDAQIQSITQSLLVNLWKGNGSGDHLPSLGASDTQKTKVLDGRDSVGGGECRRGDGDSEKVKVKNNEISIACQTEAKSPVSDSERFYKERKALERRINEEKESQIKWIENEIYHLNILRGLLEKQNSSLKKKQSPSPRSEDTYLKTAVAEVHPAPVTPVYGCTVSVDDLKSPDEKALSSEEGNSTVSLIDSERVFEEPEGVKYGMAMSLSGGPKCLQQVVMLPVGVQVTLKNKDFPEDCNRQSAFQQKSPQRSPISSDKSWRRYRVSQSDFNTQYPSLKRVSRRCASASAQTNFLSPRRCSLCRQENCVCLDLSRTSNESASRSSKNKAYSKNENHKVSCAQNDSRSTSNSINADIFDTDSNPNTKTKEKVSGNGSESSSSFAKSKAVQNSTCKCENCPRKIGSKSTCRGPCQSNIYLNCEKPFEEGSFRCSKVQVKKSSTCACHIIRIHGSKCCSPENGTCSCKKRTSVKKMENQSCQTEEVVVKEMVNNVEIVATPEVVYPCEAKTAVERRKQVDEKMPADPKIIYEAKKPCSAKLEAREKTALEKQTPKEVVADVKTPCKCGDKNQKEKAKNDHPRHYFLKIEEKEVDELNESIERRQSLEVITVTVPVKKTEKAKLYGKGVRSEQSNSCSVESFKGLKNTCNCCEKCLGRICKRMTEEYRRCEAEKPHSPKRLQALQSSERYSFEDVSGGNSYHYLAQNYKSSSSQEYKGSAEYSRSDVYCAPEEYDSHKKARRREGEENYEKQSRERKDENYGSDKYDYYNYNKREYMTKSEVEKERRMRSHQPSLQECLASNRPDFYNNAESRRQIISERAKERVKKHNNRMECLINLIHHCDESERSRSGPKRIFTTSEMREQTLRRYKKLPEVTGKIADQKKKEEYRTNKLMADIFAKKLQIQALKGHINLSNSISILSTI